MLDRKNMTGSVKNNNEPIYIDLQNDIIAQITTGALRPGEPIMSEKQLSMRYKVSRSTVRKALDGLSEMGYILKSPGKNTLVRGNMLDDKEHNRIRTIKVIVNAEHNYTSEIVAGLNEGIKHKNSRLIYEMINSTLISDSTVVNPSAEYKIDAMAVLPVWSESPYELLLNKPQDIPIVVLGREMDQSAGINTVTVDHSYGVSQATEYLITLGHKRIAFVSGPLSIPYCSERLRGYTEMHAKYNLPIEESLIVTSDLDFGSCYRDARSLLKLSPRPTAMFIGGGAFAWPCCKAILEAGIRIPQDISVIVYDDIVEASGYNPPLSVVRQPLNVLGRTGVNILLDALCNPGKKKSVNIVLKPELVIRQSCSSPDDGESR